MLDDLRYALRALRQAPAFCLIVITTLALGLGANTAVFGVVHAALLAPLPYPAPERLVRMTMARGGEPRFFPGASLVDFRDASRTLDIASVYTYSEQGLDLVAGGRPERVRATAVSANYFDVMGVPPIVGAPFTREDERPEARVAVVSERVWREYLGGRSTAAGETLSMSGVPYRIAGVMPASFRDPLQPDVEIWTPENLQPGSTNSWSNSRLTVLARLRPGATLESAAAEADVIVARQQPHFRSAAATTVAVTPLQTALAGPATPMLLVLSGAVALLLLLACVNVATLLLARTAARAQETTVKAALGCPRWRVVRQLLIESVMLSLAGGAAGLLMASAVSDGLIAAAPVSLPAGAGPLRMDVFGYCFALALIAGLAFGLAPALQASRPDLEAALREGGRTSGASRRQARTWNLLVAGQVALALVLLVGAGLLLGSFRQLLAVDLGVTTTGVTTFQVNLPTVRYADGPARTAFHARLHERLAALPGVRAAGAVSRLPVTGTYHSWPARVAGQSRQFSPEHRVVAGAYFDAVNIPLVSGRLFDERDGPDTERRVVISAALAQAMFPEGEPIGRTLEILNFRATIVGVVGDVALDARGTRAPAVYHAHAQFADNRNWALAQVVAGSVDVAMLRRELAAVDAGLVLHEPRPLEEVVGRDRARERFSLWLIGTFAATAVILAAIGLYGVLAYAVSSRRKEIGIRLALGAPAASVRRLFVGRGAMLAAAGIAAGTIGAVVLTRAMQSLLFGVRATDPVVYAAAAGVLLLVALASAWVPARAAARVDPLEALGR